MENAIGYIRVSTEAQDFERQRDEIIQYATKNSFNIAKIFEDKQSGSDYDDRQGFQDLLIYLDENPHIKIIIFDEISRMGRDTAMQVSTYKALTKKGIRVFTRGKGEFGKGKEDSLLFTVLSAIADYEKQTIIDRTSSGRKKVVRDGATQISHRPYGYNILFTEKQNRQIFRRQFIEVNAKEAVSVKKMFEMIAQGKTVFDVLRYLGENKIKSMKSEKWGKSSVLRILHSTTYYGEWKFGKYVKNHKTKHSLSKRAEDLLVTVPVPAIISKELFDTVQEKLKKNRIAYNPRNQKLKFIFKGLLKCDCGRVMQAIVDTRSGERSYRCPERNMAGISVKQCAIKTIKADYFESIILRQLKESISSVDFLKDSRMKQVKELQSPHKLLLEQKESLITERNKGKDLLKRYYEKIVNAERDGVESEVLQGMIDTLVKRSGEIGKEVAILDGKISDAKDKIIDMNSMESLQRAMESLRDEDLLRFESNIDEKISFAREYIDAIQVKVDANETEHARKMIAKDKKDKVLYATVFNKQGDLRRSPLLCLVARVHFSNHYTETLRFKYAHDNPGLFESFLVKTPAFKIVQKGKKREFVPDGVIHKLRFMDEAKERQIFDNMSDNGMEGDWKIMAQ